MSVTPTTPQEWYDTVMAKVRNVRRKAFMRLWQVPVAIAYGMLPVTVPQGLRVSDTPYGPLIHSDTFHVPETEFAYTSQGNPLIAFETVTDGYTAPTVSIESIVNEYMERKKRFLYETARFTARICDVVTGQPQTCKTVAMLFGEPRTITITVNTEPEYIDHPENYVPVKPYKITLAGQLAWRLMDINDLPQEWYDPATNTQPYLNIYFSRGRVAMDAVYTDAQGNQHQGVIADLGFALYIESGIDVPVVIQVPPLAELEVLPWQRSLMVMSQTFNFVAKFQ